jgi:hypothetical protein
MRPEVEIKKSDIETFSFGPDTLIATDFKTFSEQHKKNVRLYFETLLCLIKERKLQDNSEVMAFLYGQLDHYALDIACHPLIYYMTEGAPKEHKLALHGLVEMWLDDYIMQFFDKKEKHYFHKWYLRDPELRKLVDNLYEAVFNVKGEAAKYTRGIIAMNILDTYIRTNAIKIAPFILEKANVGDILYHYNEFERVLPYLNHESKKWTIPWSGEESTDTLEQLWHKSFPISLEMIETANNYLYRDRELSSQFMPEATYFERDCSYNTGLPCVEKEEFPFVKKY